MSDPQSSVGSGEFVRLRSLTFVCVAQAGMALVMGAIGTVDSDTIIPACYFSVSTFFGAWLMRDKPNVQAQPCELLASMNYQKIITDLEHHASEAAEFLASYPDPDEMESEKAAHRAMVCAVHALKKLMQERAALEIENNKLRSELTYIVDFDCGHWAAGKHENEAIRMGYLALKQIAADAIANGADQPRSRE